MSAEEDLPTGPGSAPPDTFHEETAPEQFARLAGALMRDSLAPVQRETAELNRRLDDIVRLAQKVFDRVESVSFEIGKRVDAAERRITALEHRVDEIENSPKGTA